MHYHPVPIMFDISLASCQVRILRNWFCFTLILCTHQSATYYVPLASIAVIANITKATQYSIQKVGANLQIH